MLRQAIHSDRAPAAIGPYSQATRAGNTVYFSGQVPIDPATGNLVDGDIAAQARRAFDNLKAVCEAAGGSFDDIVRVGLYLTDLSQFSQVNAVMAEYFSEPYPARSTIEVSALPRGAAFEVDAIMVLGWSRAVSLAPRGPRHHLRAFLPVPVQRSAHQQHQRDRRGHREEGADQDLVQHQPAVQHRKARHRGGDHQERPHRRGQGRRMHALVEIPEAKQAQRADEGQGRSRQCQQRDGNGSPRRQQLEMVHSITSPRIRNLDTAMVLAKPSRAMISAASKYIG